MEKPSLIPYTDSVLVCVSERDVYAQIHTQMSSTEKLQLRGDHSQVRTTFFMFLFTDILDLNTLLILTKEIAFPDIQNHMKRQIWHCSQIKSKPHDSKAERN